MKEKKKVKIRGFIWVYIIGIIVVVAGVMGFGLIGTLWFSFDEGSALIMLAMFPIMAGAYTLAIRPVVRSLKNKMEKLVDGMYQVSDGNLSYRIDTEKAGEYKELYKIFNSMAAELEKTRDEMENFTNEFAHEFKTPITAINGFSEILLEGKDAVSEEEKEEYLKLISEESRRLLNLSQNTLLLSKVEAMQIVSEKEEYDLAEQIRYCLILLNKSIAEKNIEIEMDEDLVLPFLGNKELLQHVWLNLLSNAVKFTPKGGQITVFGKTEENDIEIRITDTGIGMDEKTMEKIFDKYYQNDSVSLTKGSGIGLSIVKRIVTLCGGKVLVYSMVGTGSTFSVHLPRQ
ncbi:MAG: HAMP domain-containing histidine kinase [Lachnospiraceae bacterium]|nr:HAMP domain-containing histidine kinase [Lachnospiraceae bacterium]